jgi:hypothetical protein
MDAVGLFPEFSSVAELRPQLYVNHFMDKRAFKGA